jgi:Kdo2-lipid IVA lauroyltransferase/acyltransferase
MTTLLFKIIFRLLSALPLCVLHQLGTLLGRLTYAFSSQYAARMRENLQQAGFILDGKPGQKLLSAVIAEAGKSIAELPWVWGRPYEEVPVRCATDAVYPVVPPAQVALAGRCHACRA